MDYIISVKNLQEILTGMFIPWCIWNYFMFINNLHCNSNYNSYVSSFNYHFKKNSFNKDQKTWHLVLCNRIRVKWKIIPIMENLPRHYDCIVSLLIWKLGRVVYSQHFGDLQYLKLIWAEQGEVAFEALDSILHSFAVAHRNLKTPWLWKSCFLTGLYLILNDWINRCMSIQIFQFRPKNSLPQIQTRSVCSVTIWDCPKL